MLGYPGSGKTTASKIIHELTGGVHLWADKIRNERHTNPTHSHQENLDLYNYLNEMTAELLATGQSVIFDTAFNFYKDREYLRSIASDHDARVILIWVITEKELAKQRATHENHADENLYPYIMPEERFERIVNDFELPHPNERCIKLDGTKITKKYVKANIANLL